MVQVSQEHLDFIPKIYETIVEPKKWAGVLRDFSSFCGAAEAQLALGDTLNREILHRPRSFKCDPKILKQIDDFASKSGGEPQAFEVVSQYPIRTWIPEEVAFGKSPDKLPLVGLTKDLLGVERAAALRLNATPIWFDGLTLNFKNGRGNITDEEIAISQIFLPHIAKAVEMSRPFLLLKQRFKAILSAIDRLQIGIVITDQKTDIITNNLIAEEFLAADNGLSRSTKRKLLTRSGKLENTLAQQIFSAANTKDPTSFEAVISIPKRNGELPWVLEIFPLGNLDGEIDQQFKGAAVFITDPEKQEIVSTKGMEELFNLTRAELDVCELITRGFRAEDIAEERNTTLHTIRSQIKSLFMKTATSNQVDLVRLALKVNLPVERKP